MILIWRMFRPLLFASWPDSKLIPRCKQPLRRGCWLSRYRDYCLELTIIYPISMNTMAFSGLVYRKRGRDASASFYVAPTGLDCSLLLLPRAMPWASIFRPFGAERNPLYSNPENGLVNRRQSTAIHSPLSGLN